MSLAATAVVVKSVTSELITAVPLEIETPEVFIEFAFVGAAVPDAIFQTFTVAVPASTTIAHPDIVPATGKTKKLPCCPVAAAVDEKPIGYFFKLVTFADTPSVPVSVIVLLTENVFPSAIVSVALVAGAVKISLLTLVAVATPISGVISVGPLSTTNFVPVPVWDAIAVAFPTDGIGPVKLAFVVTVAALPDMEPIAVPENVGVTIVGLWFITKVDPVPVCAATAVALPTEVIGPVRFAFVVTVAALPDIDPIAVPENVGVVIVGLVDITNVEPVPVCEATAVAFPMDVIGPVRLGDTVDLTLLNPVLLRNSSG